MVLAIKVYLIHMLFRDLNLLPSSYHWLSLYWQRF